VVTISESSFKQFKTTTMTVFCAFLQYTWTTGNRWGDCGNGTSVLGCGPQETFMSCSDISIKEPEV
jgi:hypothetical protein